MGTVFSQNNPNDDCLEGLVNDRCKRQKIASYFEQSTRLIPCLPNEISLQILSRVPRVYYLKLKLVSRGWKEAISTPDVYELRKELNITEEWLYILSRSEQSLLWYALDPVTQVWQKLPPLPCGTQNDASRKGLAIQQMWSLFGSRAKIAEAIRGWLRRGDIFDNMSYCGCFIGAVHGSLYVLGGLSRTSVLRSVWRYDPILNTWNEATPMLIGRAYSKTGVINNKLYVVGGVTKHRGSLTPLQSAEVFDPETNEWSEVPSMPFAKAQIMPTAFLADLLKPIATGLTTYHGKLYVPQSLYCWPFFVDAGGEIYDPETNSWVEMPVGMGEGWPAKQAGTKLSAVVDDELYALDLSGSLDSAKIKVYDHQDDSWKVALIDVPMARDLNDAECPYLLAGLRGKLHVVIKDSNNDVTVLEAVVIKSSPILSSHSNSPCNVSSSDEILASSSQQESMWEVVASRRAGDAELVSCQILSI